MVDMLQSLTEDASGKRRPSAGLHLEGRADFDARKVEGYTCLSTEMWDRLTEMGVIGVTFQPMREI